MSARVRGRLRLAVVQSRSPAHCETFLRAQIEGLPGEVRVIHGAVPHLARERLFGPSSSALLEGAWQLARGVLPRGSFSQWSATCAYLRGLRRLRPDVVLAQYGPMGARVHEACRRSGTPLVVHFHGYDASHRPTLAAQARAYQRLFRDRVELVAVSRPMRERLIGLGARPERVHLIPYGVDTERFAGGDPAAAPPVFVAAGRFVEKKAPHLTLLAFARLRQWVPEAELRMIGDGPLLPLCRDLVAGLGLGSAVSLLGARPHDEVAKELRAARAFVQHSVEAADGDCEGTPLAVLEAGATGLPCLATRHAGIPEAVLHGETGLLVAPRDVEGMAEQMRILAREPALAAELGVGARERVRSEYALGTWLERLAALLAAAARRGR